jgi:MFS family permease
VVGRKYVLYAAIILFGIGSVIFATATDMSIIVVGRLIKGVGAGGLDVLQTIILCDITTLKERPRWLGVLSMANAVGAVTGPFIGGVFAEQVGWRWLGWINLITAGIIGVLTFFFLHLTPIEGGIKDKMRKLDRDCVWILLRLIVEPYTPLSPAVLRGGIPRNSSPSRQADSTTLLPSRSNEHHCVDANRLESKVSHCDVGRLEPHNDIPGLELHYWR